MSGRDPQRLQWASFALGAAGSLAACGAADTPESSTPSPAEDMAQRSAEPAQPPSEAIAMEPVPPAPPPQEKTPPQAQTATPPEPQAPSAEPPPAPPQRTAPEKTKTEPAAVVITTMSKGRGVPAPTRDAYKEIRGLLEQQQSRNAVTNIDTQRIGLEGEMRMCAEFSDRAKAEYTLEQIRKISADVELIHVAEGPCPTPLGDKKP